MNNSAASVQYLRQWWAVPKERQARHLNLRDAHTVALTDNASSTEVWATNRIIEALAQSTVYREYPLLLDAGCGGGYYLEQILATSQLVLQFGLGLDRSFQALEAARARLSQNAALNYTLLQASVLQLPFQSASFGAAMCNRMLNQTGDIAGALAQVARTLRPAGSLFIVTADSEQISWLRAAHEAALEHLNFPTHLYRHTTPPDQRFNLQNGPTWLAPLFNQVRTQLYERKMTFTEADMLREYYATGLLFQKSAGFDEPGVRADQWIALYETVGAAIEQQLAEAGSISFQDGATLFSTIRKTL